MISVQNHQQRLSGNKLLVALSMLLAMGACSPKTTGVLRAPGHVGGQTGQTQDDNKVLSSTEVAAEKERKEAEAMLEKRRNHNGIALVLPFQLDKLDPNNLSKNDVTRSSLALDFYQGFQLGLDEVAKRSKSFVLDVIDSRDDENYNGIIAKSADVVNASLVVGPVYPKEIRAFGANLNDKAVLQVNPLAASNPTDYNIPNLVTLTPSLSIHTRAVAQKMARDYKSGDIIFIYNTTDADGKQFLAGFAAEVRKTNPSAKLQSVNNVTQLNDALSNVGNNLIAIGTTDKNELRNFLNNLDKKEKEGFYSFKIFGHPLWDKIDFSAYENFEHFRPTISSENHIKSWTVAVKNFKDSYYTAYGVNPSDHSYKGYDVARYFGSLLNKYGPEYAKHLSKETFDGLFSSYQFEKNNNAGYINNAVSFKEYKGTSFQLN
ncbi:ABC transporter substrate-binding protein [Sphingobacterium sp. MYb382]|uniref:ABC transporter substrate-binding protein n=1 Tax=Sphingobacterium sp. MYb382 TaxID=2745278 RepID=UPI00309737BB